MKQKKYCIITGVLLLTVLLFAFVHERNKKMEHKWDGNMDYYLFSDSAVNVGASDTEHFYSLFNGEEDEILEGELNFNKYKNNIYRKLGLENELDNEAITYVSTDGQWLITENQMGENRYGEKLRRQTLYYNEERKKEIIDTYTWTPPLIVRDKEGFKQIDEVNYRNIEAILDEGYENGYYGGMLTDESGHLVAGIKSCATEGMPPQISVWDIETQKITGGFPLQNIDKDNKATPDIIQFYGDGKEGKIIFCHGRKFYELNYPTGEIHLLGRDMYYLSYSPDGKYIAYSSIGREMAMELEPDIVENFLSGIFILEVKTGKKAYIKSELEWWQLAHRRFYWVKKEALNQ